MTITKQIEAIEEKFGEKFVQFENGVVVGGYELAPYERIKSFYRQEITTLLTALRAEVEEYFGHIGNDGSGKPMNVSQDEIARDVLSIIDGKGEK